MTIGKKYLRLLSVIVILLLATYLLTPRFWEPGPERWKQWATARIMRETGHFPGLPMGPLYVIYLQLFQFFDYPFSVRLEYFVTHLFSYTAIFLMLRGILPNIIALLLTCAWIPMIAVLSPGGAVAGIGFIALYFRNGKIFKPNNEYFSLSLLMAVLCNMAYSFFLLGHIIGVFIERRKTKQPIVNFIRPIRWPYIFSLITKAGLLIILILATLSQLNHPYYMIVDQTYSPIPIKNHLAFGFFHIGNWKYVMRTVPKSLWIYQDWYLTHEKAFGGAQTILQAILKKPHTVFLNILDSIFMGTQAPRYLTTFNARGPLAVVFWLLLPIGFIGMIQRFKANRLTPYIFSVIFGTIAVIISLLLTWPNRRYVMLLLPIALLVVAHIGTGLWYLVKFLCEEISKKEKIIVIFSSLLILTGTTFNIWTLSTLFHRVLSFWSRVEIWSLDILLIATGIFFIISIIHRTRFLTRVKYNYCLNVGKIIVMISAMLVLSTSIYPHGKMAQIKSVLNNQALLSGAIPVSMTTAYPELLNGINEKMHILVMEDTWFKAFSRADLKNVVNVMGLPPFPDSSGKTEKMLDNLDAILVSYNFSKEMAYVSTQFYLRYLLHIKPFLEKAQTKGWTVQEIQGYGKIYRRPIPK